MCAAPRSPNLLPHRQETPNSRPHLPGSLPLRACQPGMFAVAAWVSAQTPPPTQWGQAACEGREPVGLAVTREALSLLTSSGPSYYCAPDIKFRELTQRYVSAYCIRGRRPGVMPLKSLRAQ